MALCTSCGGTGCYDVSGSPPCSACDGYGIVDDPPEPIDLDALRTRIDPAALAILDHPTWTPRTKLNEFEKLNRPPTVDEIRFDFADRGNDSEYCLLPQEAVQVLLKYIDELEGR